MSHRSSWSRLEEEIDARRRRPTLRIAADQILPPTIVLLTDEPQACVRGKAVKRVFVLGFRCRDNKLLTHVEDHTEGICNVQQMRWALETFQAHLEAAQLA